MSSPIRFIWQPQAQTLPEDTPLNELVANAHHRWRIEREHQDLKQEFGLGHYEGRGWRGFHHHASLCIAAYGFLMAERLDAERPGASEKKLLQRQAHAVPDDYIPRGSPARTAARPDIDRDSAP